MTTDTAGPALAPAGALDDAGATPGAVRARRRRRKRIVIGAGALLAVAAGVVLVARPNPAVVEVGVVSRGTLTSTLDEPGYTRMEGRAIIGAPSAGELLPPVLDAGDVVAAGAVVAQIEPVPVPLLDTAARSELTAAADAASASAERARAELWRAEAALDKARRERARAERLVSGGALAPAAADDARDAVRGREHELDAARFGAQVAAQQHVAQRAAQRRAMGQGARAPAPIASPFDGVVLALLREDGGVVAAGEPLVEIGDPRSLMVRVPVLTDDAVDVRPRARVLLGLGGPAHAGVELRGHVRLVEPKAVTKISALGVEEQRVNVIVDFDDPPPATLGDAFEVQARIVRWQGEVVRAPAGALFRRGDGWAVWVESDGKARARAVTVGHRAGAWAEITAGLAPGERVVLYPGDAVRDGSPLRERRTAP